MNKARIIIADDHMLLTEAIKNLLEPEYEVVGTFADGESLINGIEELSPDIALIDVMMPTIDGLSASAHLKKLIPKIKIIFVSMDQCRETVSEAFRCGASGYVLKTSAAVELKVAIREVLRGGYFATPSLTVGMIGSFVQNFKRMKDRPELTLRQREVLRLLTEGHSMKQVAGILNITPRTVAFHKYTMMNNLEITSSAELVSYAIKNGMGVAESVN
jgi:DNA-binding NarL/FixJ family response regulator